MNNTTRVISRLLGFMLFISVVCLAPELRADAPLPDDLQLVLPDSLPARASWYSFTRWGKYPPSPVNWCADRDNVLYYRSASFGTNRIIIDDTAVEYPTPAEFDFSALLPCEPLGPSYGPDDIWLEIRFDTNLANNIDLILHNATNGFWQIESKTNVADPNLPWTFVDADLVDAKADLFFGPFADTYPSLNFYRAARIEQPFEIVATNLPSPVGIDYSPAQQALILAVNYKENAPNNFAILDSNSVLSAWSGISGVDAANETRLCTVRVTNGNLSPGDLLFGSATLGLPPATIGWLSADGTTSNLNWAVLTNEQNIVEGLYVDQTGIWSNDVLVVCGQDTPLSFTTQNVWRVHSPADIRPIAAIPTSHLEGLLTLPDDAKYGPWAGKLITADENQHKFYAVAVDGTVAEYSQGFDVDTFLFVPTDHDLYCLVFRGSSSILARLSRTLLRHHTSEVLAIQSGETGSDPAIIFLRWSGTDFETRRILLHDYLVETDFFEKGCFAPIILPTITP